MNFPVPEHSKAEGIQREFRGRFFDLSTKRRIIDLRNRRAEHFDGASNVRAYYPRFYFRNVSVIDLIEVTLKTFADILFQVIEGGYHRLRHRSLSAPQAGRVGNSGGVLSLSGPCPIPRELVTSS